MIHQWNRQCPVDFKKKKKKKNGQNEWVSLYVFQCLWRKPSPCGHERSFPAASSGLECFACHMKCVVCFCSPFSAKFNMLQVSKCLYLWGIWWVSVWDAYCTSSWGSVLHVIPSLSQSVFISVIFIKSRQKAASKIKACISFCVV